MKKEREKRESAAQPVDTRLVGKPPAEGAQLSMCVPNRSRFREIEVEKWIWKMDLEEMDLEVMDLEKMDLEVVDLGRNDLQGVDVMRSYRV